MTFIEILAAIEISFKTEFGKSWPFWLVAFVTVWTASISIVAIYLF